MKPTMKVLLLVVLALTGTLELALAQEHFVFSSDKIEWKEGPASLAPGTKMAILRGDPTKPGMFLMRLKLPVGYIVAPHWHTQDENVTVISGALLIGDGERFDAARLEKVTPGNLMVMPATHRHFARFDEETVLQLQGLGPWVVNYVNPADDPRKQ
jgi:hypothetical protein